MVEYALAWHPHSDNMGDDLRALAAMHLLPRVDRVLDADRLSAELPGLCEGDRVVALLTGNVLRETAHWPPEEHIAPVCVGVHISREDVWGVPFRHLSGTAREALLACGPIGCRDASTASLLEEADVPHTLTGCITLTLARPEAASAQRHGVCCVDVPDSVCSALRSVRLDGDVREITHRLDAEDRSFSERMADAEALLKVYAEAELVVTRRLHCAMACLAIGTPVALLYNSGYEDVTRFSPWTALCAPCLRMTLSAW